MKNEESDSCTVTVKFKNEKQRRQWLTETIEKAEPFSVSFSSKSSSTNIDLDLSSLYKENTEDGEQLMLPFEENTENKIPFGRIPNCS